jgi:predicted transcriptional regulator
MLPDLRSIKRIRKTYNLSQKELAERSEVSQSMIAKIEAGKIEPSYNKAQKIFASLQRVQKSNDATAHECMNTSIIFAKPTNTVHESIKIMQSRGISQIPIQENDHVTGLISESLLVDLLVDTNKHIKTIQVQNVMQDAPPIVPWNTTQRSILELLKEHQIVLVSQKGKIKGIISRADMLAKI